MGNINGSTLKELDYVAYSEGNNSVYANIEAIHAERPNADLNTGPIVQSVAGQTGSSLILSRISRDIMDLNRPRGRFNYPAVDQYRDTVRHILRKRGILGDNHKLEQPFLHLSLHGMQDDWKRDLEIGTGYGHYCSPEVKNWFVNQMAGITNSYGVDDLFPGYTFRSVLRDGDLYSSTDFIGFGVNYHAIQLEVSRYWRKEHQNFLVSFLKEIIRSFHHKFVPNPAFMVDGQVIRDEL